jgi:hypothetical protein
MEIPVLGNRPGRSHLLGRLLGRIGGKGGTFPANYSSDVTRGKRLVIGF